VTGKDTDNAFAVVETGDSQSDPLDSHYRKETHVVFLCLQGSVSVWARDKYRKMSAGGLASVPPVCVKVLE
jgi:quercetin dioxygenase-like cupin family protein